MCEGRVETSSNVARRGRSRGWGKSLQTRITISPDSRSLPTPEIPRDHLSCLGIRELASRRRRRLPPAKPTQRVGHEKRHARLSCDLLKGLPTEPKKILYGVDLLRVQVGDEESIVICRKLACQPPRLRDELADPLSVVRRLHPLSVPQLFEGRFERTFAGFQERGE